MGASGPAEQSLHQEVIFGCFLVRFSSKSVRFAGYLVYSSAISLYFRTLNGCMTLEMLILRVSLPTSPRSCFRSVSSNSFVS